MVAMFLAVPKPPPLPSLSLLEQESGQAQAQPHTPHCLGGRGQIWRWSSCVAWDGRLHHGDCSFSQGAERDYLLRELSRQFSDVYPPYLGTS